jgi:hypothetical protein
MEREVLKSLGTKFSPETQSGQIIINSGTQYWVWSSEPKEISKGVFENAVQEISLPGLLGMTWSDADQGTLDAFMKSLTPAGLK